MTQCLNACCYFMKRCFWDHMVCRVAAAGIWKSRWTSDHHGGGEALHRDHHRGNNAPTECDWGASAQHAARCCTAFCQEYCERTLTYTDFLDTNPHTNQHLPKLDLHKNLTQVTLKCDGLCWPQKEGESPQCFCLPIPEIQDTVASFLHLHARLRHHRGQLLPQLDLLPAPHQPAGVFWGSLWLSHQQGGPGSFTAAIQRANDNPREKDS